MDRIFVRRSDPLEGTVAIGGAKNSVLKLMAATTLAEGRFVLHNVPAIDDVDCMSDLLRSMGMTVGRTAAHDLTIDRPPTSSSSGCGRRSSCWARCWPVKAGPAWPCRVGTTSGPGPSTCT